MGRPRWRGRGGSARDPVERSDPRFRARPRRPGAIARIRKSGRRSVPVLATSRSASKESEQGPQPSGTRSSRLYGALALAALLLTSRFLEYQAIVVEQLSLEADSVGAHARGER